MLSNHARRIGCLSVGCFLPLTAAFHSLPCNEPQISWAHNARRSSFQPKQLKLSFLHLPLCLHRKQYERDKHALYGCIVMCVEFILVIFTGVNSIALNSQLL